MNSIFQSLVRKDMPSNSRSNTEQQYFNPEHRNQKKDAIEHRNPQKQNRNNFRTLRDSFMFSVITDVRSKIFLVYQPKIEFGRTAKIKRSRKQQKRSGRQQRKKNPQDTKCQ